MDRCNRRIAATLVALGAFHVAAAAAAAPPPPATEAAAWPAGGAGSARGATPASDIQVEGAGRYWKALAAIGFRGVGLVARDGRLLLLEGSGGVSPQASFDIASIAKSLTAVAVLRVARRGELSLDDPLTRFFPEAPADKRTITVHQLLTHTAGIGIATGDTAAGVRKRGEAVRMILATPLVGAPGKGFSYSNDGYTLLAAILEVARSMTWEAVVREEVLRPAGMDHTFFAGDPRPSGPRSVAQAAVAGAPSSKAEADWGAKGGAGIFSTADDLMHFMNAAASDALLGPGGAAEIGKSYAPPGDLLQYSRVFRLVSFPGRGAEWSHGGADTDTGHYSKLLYYPDSKVVLVVLGLDYEDLISQVTSGLGKALFGEGAVEVPPASAGHPATGFKEPMTLAGEGLRFTIAPAATAARLLPDDAASTSFLLARSGREKDDLETCVRQTRQLLDEVARAAGSGAAVPDDVFGHLVTFWREAGRESGEVKEATVLGATPNWADSLGGTLAFVRVVRERQTAVFRLYWNGGKLVARGGRAHTNPAPMALIDYGGDHFGVWNPALGRYADLRLVTSMDGVRKALLSAAGKTVTLDLVTAGPSPGAAPGRAGAAPAPERTFPLDSTGGLELVNVKAEVQTYRGRRALRLLEQPGITPDGEHAIAVLASSDFKDGTIEVDVAGAPRQGAIEQARGFIGVAFRVQPHAARFEYFYLRPTNGRAEDQLRRNHATQYASHPDYPWERLRKEQPGVYESYVDLEAGAWTHLKMVVSGRDARLYLHGAEQPCLIVHDLKLGDTHGRIALWIGLDTEGYFSNLTVR
ncbi:MAG TPA: serine hydrolase domain-containing protein [Thermoanaerobaculia bacterium]|nr:serine hydrolase domain-containing protein [Thermoanaerobaculia bacterium]